MTDFPLKKVLIANRGEIAVRIARAARDLGMKSIAVYSEADVDALHTRVADEAYALPGSTARETYMNVPALLDIADRAGADCVHPGYGFLSENSDFARAVEDAGLTWVGPSSKAIDLLGDKLSARELATKAGAPLAPGTPDPLSSWEQARDFADEHGLPIAIKAAFGGGGRGLKVVHERGDIEEAFLSAGREAGEAFGRSECYVEKFLTHPRHVEAQVLADTHGNVVVLGTRDCSTQRRYQKLIEEAPAPFLTDEQREGITEGARSICREAGYTSAGTVEYIVAEDGTVSFLEVNTRLQVEHPVTEETTGVDIVAEQFRVAAGLPLSITEDPTPRGHAFEFRINAEDIANGFAPCPGTVALLDPPTGPGVRVDAGVRTGGTVPSYYDSLLGKLIVWGPDREVALRRARQALAEFEVTGVRTVLPFHRDMVDHEVLSAEGFGIYTDWVDSEYTPRFRTAHDDIAAIYQERTALTVEIDGRAHELRLPVELLSLADAASAGAGGSAAGGPGAAGGAGGGSGAGAGAGAGAAGGAGAADDGSVPVTASFAGSLVEWKVPDGAAVDKGEAVATVEAMKMESTITAPAGGTLTQEISEGTQFDQGDRLGSIA
ncbi:biotin carboxylase N-terminal domain-containing protein [Corynebacterium frankenforstense]|uniref:acetyl/propionyl/methylcrotonyl-CoA carboxylase subunit alpha n=1 Tax=Corynebacterium TaxID=1716 RepID=UPI00254B99F8|nr:MULTISPECIES: biotin carboxylase N-terminal domain-containing protein [Corynebacterium]MDK6260152.1 biotin carboxylase N-terminal domain-containing protein [Corynebacterium frankenforstense]MDK8895946.1 biotin carboxylase N-terminal domain-containing protein [Corynebacterium sp. MSK006]